MVIEQKDEVIKEKNKVIETMKAVIESNETIKQLVLQLSEEHVSRKLGKVVIFEKVQCSCGRIDDPSEPRKASKAMARGVPVVAQ